MRRRKRPKRGNDRSKAIMRKGLTREKRDASSERNTIHIIRITRARSPFPSQRRGQGEGSGLSITRQCRSPHLHPLPFAKGRGGPADLTRLAPNLSIQQKTDSLCGGDRRSPTCELNKLGDCRNGNVFAAGKFISLAYNCWTLDTE